MAKRTTRVKVLEETVRSRDREIESLIEAGNQMAYLLGVHTVAGTDEAKAIEAWDALTKEGCG